ncbi:MAG TPA: CDP-glycerol glycerophosphotransferase family protein [Gemmataceae bacterium]|nr:CDP-glycerol glycerophosphotransferase family protein [Gemmataceae bacterium]
MTAEASPIVAIAGDPGGAAAVAPVLELLRQQGRRLRSLAYRQAVANWRSRGLDVEELPPSTNVEQAQRYLSTPRAGILLSATSDNGINLEKPFFAAARRLGIPSLAVLDHWMNYRLRFANEQGELAYLPDRIAIMDAQAQEEMIADGLDAGRLVVTGQPAFDELTSFRRSVSPQLRQEVRQRLGIGDDQRIVLFASEPISTMCGTEPSQPLYPGYTEQTVLREVATALQRIAARTTEKVVLVVRPHPLDNPKSLHLAAQPPLRLVVDGRGKGREVVLASDLVTGMTTVLLVEACLLGCVVLSVQPGLRFADALPTNRWGVSRVVYRGEEIEPALASLLFDEAIRAEAVARTEKIRIEPGAAQRIVCLLDSMLGRPSV